MKYTARIIWEKSKDEKFTDHRYSRKHRWSFDGGLDIKASSSPGVVPVPMSDESAVDPEEAFVAAISSCHMLFFLSIAAGKSYVVESYEDQAEGIMGKNERGERAMTNITLRPRVVFSDVFNAPDAEQISELHSLAHRRCFLANSVQSKINISL
ncbi:OsmC family protein [Fulvivirga ulvae]|uniref:OsmC family protein n=1 Tax=Fulvivirga ulvae TaxID=2904245 RepID=UPI001F1AD474|nr:OsmC family protein [Fulvivirga ulvae]UII32864.1 OsmC family protein [Fulvivirga ulvae]